MADKKQKDTRKEPRVGKIQYGSRYSDSLEKADLSDLGTVAQQAPKSSGKENPEKSE